MRYDLFLKHPTCLKYIETIYNSLDEEHNCLKNYHDICSAKKIGFLRFSYLLNKNYFNNIYKNEINDLKNKYGKYILILTSGTYSNFLVQYK